MSQGPPVSIIHRCPDCGHRCTCAEGNESDRDCLHCVVFSDAFRNRIAEIAATPDAFEKGECAP